MWKVSIITNVVTLDEAKRLAKQFVSELEKEFGMKFIWWYIGSIRTGKYQAGKSDIDLCIVPDESCDYGKIALRLISKSEEYKKYGTVFKKGRDISLIDPLIFFNVESIQAIRKAYHDKRG
jgi:hypothetical protein